MFDDLEDIASSNGQEGDDNIFCMTSVFVKAVLTQGGATLNHSQIQDISAQRHTYLNTHACTKGTSLHIFQPDMQICCHGRWREGTQGQFVEGIYAVFLGQYTVQVSIEQ